MSSHTPGPWIAQKETGWITWDVFACDRASTFIATINRENDNQIANARLIAAAPELLIALKDIIESGEIPYCESSPLVLQAKIAIAKAEAKP